MAAIRISLIFGLVFIAGCVGPRLVEFSDVEGVKGDGWAFVRRPNALPNETVKHVYYQPARSSFYFNVYNKNPSDVKQSPNHFYVAFSLTHPDDQYRKWTMSTSGISLHYRDQIWPSTALTCAHAGEPQKNQIHGIDRVVRIPYSIENDCVVLRFEVATPQPSERFSISLGGLKVDDWNVPIAEIFFEKGQFFSRGGFQ